MVDGLCSTHRGMGHSAGASGVGTPLLPGRSVPPEATGPALRAAQAAASALVTLPPQTTAKALRAGIPGHRDHCGPFRLIIVSNLFDAARLRAGDSATRPEAWRVRHSFVASERLDKRRQRASPASDSTASGPARSGGHASLRMRGGAGPPRLGRLEAANERQRRR